MCNLGAINLSKFVNDGVVLWTELERAVRLAIRFLDNVIDATAYFNEENERSQKAIRRVGLGSMGLADMLLKLKIRYGSPEAVKFADKLYSNIAHWAYWESTWLAEEKGAFPLFDADKFLDGEFIKRFEKKVRDGIRKRGLRNAFLLTQAPTGTTGLLSGVAGTGIEPVFAFTFRRTDRIGERIVKLPILDEIGVSEAAPYPDYVVTANDLTPKEHIDMQAAIQYWNDSAISKTANMPRGTTKEQVAELYMYAYDKGLKGITVYVDGSREGVIHHIDEQPKTAEEKPKFTKRPRKLSACVYKQQTPLGKAYVTIAESDDGSVAEVHVDLGAAGSDIAAIAKGMGLTATLALNPRLQSLTNDEKVAWLIKQYSKIHGSTSHGFGPKRVNSLPHAIAKVLEEHIASENTSEPKLHSGVQSADICPECGQATFVRQDGCQTCMTCGFSKCG